MKIQELKYSVKQSVLLKKIAKVQLLFFDGRGQLKNITVPALKIQLMRILFISL